MRYLSLFSGIEAASVAWEPLGWEPMAFAEIEPFPCAVLAERFPHVPNLGDVSKIDWSEFVKKYGRPDVLIGGSPCQSFSVAGLRKGMDDPRGNLMLEYLRAVDETTPKWIIWENVPGVLSADNGRAFGTLLGALVELGYGFAYRVLDAQFHGVAQRRRRVFVVGCAGDWKGAAAVLFEQNSLRWDSPSSREKRESLTGATSGRASICMATQQGNAEIGIDVCPTITASAGMAGNMQPICMTSTLEHAEIGHDISPTITARNSKEPPIVSRIQTVRRLTPAECERLQGFPDGHTDITFKGKPTSDAPRYKALGNSMAVPVIRWLGEGIEMQS